MLGFKCFIFSIFFGLSLGSLKEFNGSTSLFDNQLEIATSSKHIIYKSLIVDCYLKTNPPSWSFNIFKIPYLHLNDNVKLTITKTHDNKLSYLEIGDNIPLKLTSRILIFPFHFFT